MTPAQQRQLTDTNSEGNAIPFNETPGANEPADWWTDQPMAGNSFCCRDYTQWKADRLKELGWDPLALTVVLCYVEPPPPPGGGYHAILAVDIDGELWFLDNRLADRYPNRLPLPLPYTGDRKQVPGSTEFMPFEFG